jgi:hypothetical protein
MVCGPRNKGWRTEVRRLAVLLESPHCAQLARRRSTGRRRRRTNVCFSTPGSAFHSASRRLPLSRAACNSSLEATATSPLFTVAASTRSSRPRARKPAHAPIKRRRQQQVARTAALIDTDPDPKTFAQALFWITDFFENGSAGQGARELVRRKQPHVYYKGAASGMRTCSGRMPIPINRAGMRRRAGKMIFSILPP